MSEQRPTPEEWESMFATLEAELLSLEKLTLDPEVDGEVAELARAQMNELEPTLRAMKISRGFVPGRTARI